MSSIIVIGNGPSILNKNNGNIIDSFNKVVRINHYIPILEKTGTKVTSFYTTTWKLAERIHYFEKMKTFNPKIKIYDLGHPYCNPLPKEFNLIPISKEIDTFLSQFGFKPFGKSPWASTGIIVLAELLLQNDNDIITITGFDGILLNKQIDYFSDKIRSKKEENIDHNSNTEIAFVEHFIKLGRIKRL